MEEKDIKKVTVPDHLPDGVEQPDPFSNGRKPVEPLSSGVLCKPDDPELLTRSGIHLPAAHAKPTLRGVVVAVGEGTRNAQGELIPIRVVEGDRVLWNLHAGTPMEIEKVPYVLLSDKELICKINDAKIDVRNAERR